MTPRRATWAPALPVYLRRTALVGAITLVLTALAGWIIGATTGFWQALYTAPVLALAYNILFEDPLRWRRVRQERWTLEESALICHGTEGDSILPLSDILDVRARLGWTVVINLTGGQRVRIAYVERPREIAQQILAARQRIPA